MSIWRQEDEKWRQEDEKNRPPRFLARVDIVGGSIVFVFRDDVHRQKYLEALNTLAINFYQRPLSSISAVEYRNIFQQGAVDDVARVVCFATTQGQIIINNKLIPADPSIEINNFWGDLESLGIFQPM